MNTDEYGLIYYTEQDLFKALYKNPKLDINGFTLLDPEQFNTSANSLYNNIELSKVTKPDVSVEEFDHRNQQVWAMPVQYAEMDIAKWILDQCNTEAELQRCGEELLLYQERNLLNLLRFLKYFVDTMQNNNILIGLGRGSSVSSYVLYKLGVHRIDSMYYDLDVEEFLR
jgi:DNA polymerase III alpha subunit